MVLLSIPRVVIVFFAIFVVSAMPILLAFSPGAAGIGLSAGFLAPFSSFKIILLLAMVGVWGGYLKRAATLMLPLSFLLMVMVGLAIEFDAQAFPKLRYFILGAILLFAYAVSLGYSRAFVVSVAIFSSFAFHLGTLYYSAMPVIVAPLYYLIGSLFSSALIIGMGISLGLSCLAMLQRGMERVRNMPAVSTFLSFF